MQLDRSTCRRARLARDPRFDGRFFVGVRTTGVFCRPICPAVAPAERNVEYFPTAAAAAEAGFRSCLRCRPECAPGTPAWAGVSTTISRALRLMADEAQERDSVEALAARLGVGARHLRRLFVQHLGATPVAVFQTRRLLAAKRLIDETDLPLTSVAMAAGFGSVRRFNAAFRATYGRSPRAMRQPGRPREDGSASFTFQLRYRPPLDWAGMLAFLGARAIPGVEASDGVAYRRTIALGPHHAGWLDVAQVSETTLRLTIAIPDTASLLRIVSRVRRLFDLDADPMAIDGHLSADPLLAPLVGARPGFRVPGAWDGFELGVRAILGQQVSVAAATTLAGRLVRAFGRPLPSLPVAGPDEKGRRLPPGLSHIFPEPATLAEADLRGIGLPSARAGTVRALARAVAAAELSLAGDADPVETRERLLRLPGVGNWTADYIALRALGDPDAFPSADLGLLRATGSRSPREAAERARPWQPWRGYAALHLWAGASARRDVER